MQHVPEMKEEFVKARLDRAPSILEKRARSGDWKQAQYAEVARLFYTRAETAVDYYDAEPVRARLQGLLDTALKRAQDIGAAMTEVHRELVLDRIVRENSQLASRAAAGEGTTEDRIRVAELLIERRELEKQMAGDL